MSPQRTDHVLPAQSVGTPLRNQLKRVDYGIGADCIFTVECNGKHFEVFLPSNSAEGTIEWQYRNRIEAELDETELDLIFDEICDIIAVKCQPWFRKFAGSSTDGNSTRNLSDFVGPPVVSLRMITVDGQPHIVIRDDDSASYHDMTRCEIPKNCFSSDLPTFWLSDVEVLEVLKVDAVFRVQVRGATMCAKIAVQQSQCLPLQREISILQHVRANRKAALCTRVPKILGLIVSENSVLGFLMDYVATASPFSNLALYDMGSVTIADRQKWYYQVEDTLKQLHDMSLTWGDVKAENVLVDRQGNVWVTDFGGSYTTGWVGQNLAGSKQGDFQGLERLMDFLQLHG